MTKIEHRSVSASLRAVKDTDRFEITGLAAAYNTLSHDLGGFRETIAPGAFRRALKEKQSVFALVNHDASKILGRTTSGTLALSDCAEGLRFLCKLDPNQQAHQDIHSAIKRGDLDSCSFAFKAAPNGEKWETRKGAPMRTLTDVDLFDVSVVTNPAYPTGTTVQARSEVRSVDYVVDRWRASTPQNEWAELRKKAAEQEIEILREAPGDRITPDLRVVPMTQTEVDAYVDARNQVRLQEVEKLIRQDELRSEFEVFKKELEL